MQDSFQTPESACYSLCIRGQLAEHRISWFDGMSIRHDRHGNTVLTGILLDQAALHAVLRRIRDAGMTLLSVNIAEQEHRPG